MTHALRFAVTRLLFGNKNFVSLTETWEKFQFRPIFPLHCWPQVVLTVLSLVLDAPEALERQPVPTERLVERLCRLPVRAVMLPLSFNLLLVLLCAGHAFLTRSASGQVAGRSDGGSSWVRGLSCEETTRPSSGEGQSSSRQVAQ